VNPREASAKGGTLEFMDERPIDGLWWLLTNQVFIGWVSPLIGTLIAFYLAYWLAHRQFERDRQLLLDERAHEQLVRHREDLKSARIDLLSRGREAAQLIGEGVAGLVRDLDHNNYAHVSYQMFMNIDSVISGCMTLIARYPGSQIAKQSDEVIDDLHGYRACLPQGRRLTDNDYKAIDAASKEIGPRTDLRLAELRELLSADPDKP